MEYVTKGAVADYLLRGAAARRGLAEGLRGDDPALAAVNSGVAAALSVAAHDIHILVPADPVASAAVAFAQAVADSPRLVLFPAGSWEGATGTRRPEAVTTCRVCAADYAGDGEEAKRRGHKDDCFLAAYREAVAATTKEAADVE